MTKSRKKTDLLSPQNDHDGLNALLKESGVKKDKFGEVRNAKYFYSTFILYRLIANIPIKLNETNCGKSNNVIDKYYAKSFDVNTLDDSFTDPPE